MDFGAVIREARTSSGLTQADLAERAGCSTHAVWEAERGNGTVQLLLRLLSALDVRLAGLPRGSAPSEQVLKMRKRRGWGQEKLAERAGVSPAAIARLEHGNARIATLSAVLAVLAPGTRVRKPEMAKWGGGSRDERFTPPDLFARIAAVLGPVDLDPCAHSDSTVKASRYYFEADNGLTRPWKARTVYVNPPYSKSSSFIRKAHAAWKANECENILMLLPVQTQHQVFHEAVAGSADVLFLRGRLAFDRPGLPRSIAPFGNLIALYSNDGGMLERLLNQFDGIHLSRTARAGCRSVPGV